MDESLPKEGVDTTLKDTESTAPTSDAFHSAYVGTVTIVLSFLIVFSHLTALKYDLFFFHPWIDIPMHYLGGVVIGALSYYISLAATSQSDRSLSKNSYIISILLSVFLIGVIWEVYEVIFQLTEELNYVTDTIGDMIMDMLGGGTVAYYVHTRFRRLNV